MALRELLATFGINVDSTQLDRANKRLDGFRDGLAKVAGLVGAGVGAAALVGFANHVAEIGDNIRDTGIRLGLTTDAVQELGFAAAQSGASAEQLNQGLAILNVRAGEALTNGGESAKAFNSLGISLKKANGEAKDTDELFSDIVKAIEKAPSSIKKAAIAQEFFGKGGKALIPLLREGSKGLAVLRQRFKELGGGFSKQATDASDAYKDSLGELGVVKQSLFGLIAEKFLPALTRVVKWMTDVSAKALEWTKKSSILEGVIVGLTIALAPLAYAAAQAVAPFALLALIIDEIVTTLEGGDSFLKDFIDSLFGVGTTAKGIQDLKQAWADFQVQVESFWREFKPVYEALKEVAKFGFGVAKGVVKSAAAVGDFIGDNTAKAAIFAGTFGDELAKPSDIARRDNLMPRGPSAIGPRPLVASSNSVSAPMTVNINGGNPHEVRRAVEEAHQENLRNAHDQLASATDRRR